MTAAVFAARDAVNAIALPVPVQLGLSCALPSFTAQAVGDFRGVATDQTGHRLRPFALAQSDGRAGARTW